MLVCLFVLLLFGIIPACFSAPTPPIVSPTFQAKITQVIDTDVFFQGTGYEAQDYNGNKYVSDVQQQFPTEIIYQLNRYDLGKEYSYSNLTNSTTCVSSPLKGSLTSTWNWIENATYCGHDSNEGDCWNTTVGNSTGATYTWQGYFKSDGTSPNSLPTLILYEMISSPSTYRSKTVYTFYVPQIDDPTIFNVPPECLEI